MGWFCSSIRIYFKNHLILAGFIGYFKRIFLACFIISQRRYWRYTKLSPSGHYAKCFWNNQNTVKMHINFKANSNYLLLQFLFFHSLLFSFFKECTQITSVGNLQLLNAFQNQLYGPLLYLPILFWIFKRKHYYHFNNPSKRPSAIFFQG